MPHYQYLVVEKGTACCGACVPDLPGCVAVGETEQEALTLVRQAIQLHLEGMAQRGEPIPQPASTGQVVELTAA